MMETITPVNDVFRRDLTLADTGLLDPNTADSLEQGEWLVRNAAGLLIRMGATPLLGAVQVFSQRGDLAVQALGKVATLMLHQYQAETDMFLDGGGGFTVGQALTVKDVVIDTITRTGLTQAASGELVYATVTELPANNGGLLEYIALAAPHRLP
jgi:hypothetical protein